MNAKGRNTCHSVASTIAAALFVNGTLLCTATNAKPAGSAAGHSSGNAGGTAPATHLPTLSLLSRHVAAKATNSRHASSAAPDDQVLTVSPLLAGPRDLLAASPSPARLAIHGTHIGTSAKPTEQIAQPADSTVILTSAIPDTTLGANDTIVSQSGSTYTITGGHTVGGNLFESFSQFTVGTGTIARFLAAPAINNILVRVTGNSLSTIDGIIQTRLATDGTTPHPATLFLINPAGFVFNSNAGIDIGGPLVLTTANYVALGSAGTFAATNPGASVLTADAPSGLGFSAGAPAPITINGASAIDAGGNTLYQPAISPATGMPLLVVAGNISISAGSLAAAGSGSATIVSIGSTGVATIPSGGVGGAIDTTSFSQFGSLTVTNGGFVGSRGDPISGPVTITTGSLSVDGSTVASQSSTNAAGSFTLTASGAVSLTNGSVVGSDGLPLSATSGATAGPVTVTASGDVTVDGTSSLSSTSDSTASGNFELNTGGMLSLAGFVGSSAGGSIYQSFNAGSMSIAAKAVVVNGGTLATRSEFGSSGPASLYINGDITLADGGTVASEAGVTVTAQTVHVTGEEYASSSFSSGTVFNLPPPDVTSDGTLPTTITSEGNSVYQITGGTVVGHNLFESFSHFSFGYAETLQIAAAANIENIFIRVTGNQQSTIDGTIETVYPTGSNNSAALYLINPAGFQFTQNAALALGGSLAITTADYLNLGTAGRFAATNPSSSVLTSESPSAFVFTSATPAPITVTGVESPAYFTVVGTSSNSAAASLYSPTLEPAPGASLAIVAGDLSVTAAELAAVNGGTTNVVAVGSAATVGIPTSGGLNGPLNVTGVAHPADITVAGGGFLGSANLPSVNYSTYQVSYTNIASGPVYVTANNITVDASELASRSGTGTAGPLTLSAAGQINVANGGTLGSDATLGTSSGPVTISAGAISGAPPVSLPGSGSAGAISITVPPADLSVDGTLGTVVSLTSPNVYQITGGQSVGGNLFESFSHFDLAYPQTIEFIAPANITSIFARVTGNQASSNNGTIETLLPGGTLHPATLYLINPAGFVFGQNAAFNLGGNLVLTTADYLTFNNPGGPTGVFAATNPSSTFLSGGNVLSYGFSSTTPASIAVNGATYNDSQGNTVVAPMLTPAVNGSLTLIAGNISVNDAELAALGTGNAMIVSVASPGQVLVMATNAQFPLDVDSFSTLGAVTVNGGFLGADASKQISSGTLSLQAGTLDVSGELETLAGTGSAGDANIAVRGTVQVSGTLGSNATGSADPQSEDAPTGTSAGNVNMKVGSLSVTGEAGSISGSQGAGNVAVTADGDVTVESFGFLGSDASPGFLGDGGSAGTFILNGGGSLNLFGPTSFMSYLSSGFFGVGSRGGLITEAPAAAAVQINVAGGVTITDGATLGSNSGPLTVNANSFAISGTWDVYAHLGGYAPEPASLTGPSIAITTGSLNVEGGASLTANSISIQNGGSVIVDGADSVAGLASTLTVPQLAAASIHVTNGGTLVCSAVTAGNILVSGAGPDNGSMIDGHGPLTLSATQDLSVLSGGSVGDSTAHGPISITANTIEVDGSSAFGPSQMGLAAFSAQNNTATTPDVNITAAQSLTVTNGAMILADSVGSGRAGTMLITTPSLTLSGGGSLSAQAFGSGPAGSITINASTVSLTNGAAITANNFGGAAQGGTINLNSNTVLLDQSSTISAETGGGLAGELSVTADFDVSGGAGGAISIVSPTGTSISLPDTAYPVGPGTVIYNTTLTPSVSKFIASDLLGTWQLQFQTVANPALASNPDAPKGPVILDDWYVTLDGTVIGRSTGGPFVSENFGQIVTSPLVVNGSNSILTGGRGGDVNISASALQVLDGSKISAGTIGSGTAGNVNVAVGTLLVSGAGSSIDSQTAAPPFSQLTTQAGNAGNVNVTATQSLSLQTGGAISSTASTSVSGAITIATPLLTATDGSIISASGLEAGQVMVITPSLALSGNSSISTRTVLAPAGGAGADIMLDVGSLNLSGSSAISADTSGAGSGGTIAIGALGSGAALPAVTLAGGSTISAQTSASGNGGDVTMLVSSLGLSQASAISASSGVGSGAGASATGAAGDVVIASTGAVTLAQNSTLSSDGGALAPAGEISVSSAALALVGGSGISTDVASPSNAAAVKRGDVVIRTGLFSLTSSTVAANSTGQAPAGDVSVIAQNISLNQSFVGSSNTGAFNKANPPLAGNLSLSSDSDIRLLDGSVVTVQSDNGNGGALTLTAPRMIYLDNSDVRASAGGSTGGKITIDPQLIVLDGSSRIDGRNDLNDPNSHGGHQQPVTIVAGGFLLAGQSAVLTDLPDFSIDSTVANSVGRLDTTIAAPGAMLAPACGVDFGDAEISSFVVTGRGATPVQPGGWIPSLLDENEPQQPAQGSNRKSAAETR